MAAAIRGTHYGVWYFAMWVIVIIKVKKFWKDFKKCGNFYIGYGFEDIVLMTRFSVKHYE